MIGLKIESIGIVSKVSSFLLLFSAGVYPLPLLIRKSIDKVTLGIERLQKENDQLKTKLNNYEKKEDEVEVIKSEAMG